MRISDWSSDVCSSDLDLTCDADGVYLSYAPEHTGGITSAKINDIDTACEGKKIVVSFNDAIPLRASGIISSADGAATSAITLGVNNQTVKLSATGSLGITLPAGTQAADLTGFRMLIHSTP